MTALKEKSETMDAVGGGQGSIRPSGCNNDASDRGPNWNLAPEEHGYSKDRLIPIEAAA